MNGGNVLSPQPLCAHDGLLYICIVLWHLNYCVDFTCLIAAGLHTYNVTPLSKKFCNCFYNWLGIVLFKVKKQRKIGYSYRFTSWNSTPCIPNVSYIQTKLGNKFVLVWRCGQSPPCFNDDPLSITSFQILFTLICQVFETCICNWWTHTYCFEQKKITNLIIMDLALVHFPLFK